MTGRSALRFISLAMIPFLVSGCLVSSRTIRTNERVSEELVGNKESIPTDIRLLSPSIKNGNLIFNLEHRCRQKVKQTISYTKVNVNDVWLRNGADASTTLLTVATVTSLGLIAFGIAVAGMGPRDESNPDSKGFSEGFVDIGAPLFISGGALLFIFPLSNFFAAIDTEEEKTEHNLSYKTFDGCEGNAVAGVDYLVELQNGRTFSGETPDNGIVSLNLEEVEGEAPGFSKDEPFGRVSILATEEKKIDLPIEISEFNLRMWKHNAKERQRVASEVKKASIVVAVFDVHDAAGRFDKKVIVQLTNYLGTALTKSGMFRVIPRDQLRARILQEKTGTYKECFEESCQIELGKAVAAKKSLATTLLQVGKKCAVTANLLDLKAETSEKGAMVNTGCSPDELLDAMKQIAKQLSEE